jgi:probable selenium-dependent hydroxylase accessory protein YqeC
MESLSRWFEDRFFTPEPAAGVTAGPVVTVIGSGGKTSLIWLLAQSRRRRKVLVSPTAKMYPPAPELGWYDHDCFTGGRPPAAEGGPPAGISLAGSLNRETGKLEALPAEVLEAMTAGYDLVLLEGDGSRGLPLKGWADHEPVVPPYTTVTAAVIPASPLGKRVSPELVFRLPQFTALSGAEEGDILTPAHLAAVIAAGMGGRTGRGLFAAARGKKILFINQAEDEGRRAQARELADTLPGDCTAGLEGIICGSVTLDQVEVLR